MLVYAAQVQSLLLHTDAVMHTQLSDRVHRAKAPVQHRVSWHVAKCSGSATRILC